MNKKTTAKNKNRDNEYVTFCIPMADGSYKKFTMTYKWKDIK